MQESFELKTNLRLTETEKNGPGYKKNAKCPISFVQRYVFFIFLARKVTF